MKQLRLAAFAACAVALNGCVTTPIEQAPLPPEVQDARQAYADDCRPDAPVFGGDLILKADLNGDEESDYVVNGFAYQWRKDTPFCGSAGCEVQVFLSAPGGGMEQRFDGWLEEPPRIVTQKGEPRIVSGAGRDARAFDLRRLDFVILPR